jgi:hypothetical protein
MALWLAATVVPPEKIKIPWNEAAKTKFIIQVAIFNKVRSNLETKMDEDLSLSIFPLLYEG